MSGYPTSESVKAKQPPAPVNYPPSTRPRQVTNKTAPPTAPSGTDIEGKAPPPSTSRRRPPVEMESESDVDGPTKFNFAKAPKFKEDQMGSYKDPSRKRRGSQAPVDFGGAQEGREEGSGQDSGAEQDPRHQMKK
jgi:hypothetical protein